MKITYIITSLRFGGAEIGMTRLINAIESSDQAGEFEITVISLLDTPKDVIELLPNTITVCNLDVDSKRDLWRVKRAWNELSDTDVLVCSLYHATLVGVFLGKLQCVPQLLTWQHNSEYRSKRAQKLYSFCYRLSDDVLADSEAVREMLVSEFDLPRSKVSVLPIAGVDTDQFAPVQEPIPFDNDELVQIGTTGRLVPQKGYDYLLECADEISNVHFHVIGEGELENKIQDKIDQQKLSNVTLHGKVPYESLPRYFSSFDIYFQPSRYEGLCMTVIEAMSSGLPIVASETGGIQESVVKGKTGYLVSPGDIEGYGRRLQQLIDNPDRRDRFGQNGRERVKDRYSKEVFRDSFLELID